MTTLKTNTAADLRGKLKLNNFLGLLAIFFLSSNTTGDVAKSW